MAIQSRLLSLLLVINLFSCSIQSQVNNKIEADNNFNKFKLSFAVTHSTPVVMTADARVARLSIKEEIELPNIKKILKNCKFKIDYEQRFPAPAPNPIPEILLKDLDGGRILLIGNNKDIFTGRGTCSSNLVLSKIINEIYSNTTKSNHFLHNAVVESVLRKKPKESPIRQPLSKQ